MDRGSHFTSASSLHRDDGDSQSLSQVRPRPAIRLDASFSFLHGGSSRTGSPRSGPASPGLVSHPSALFAPKDMNVGNGKGGGGTTASAKSHSRRTVSGSLQATSISLSLGSSRPPSQHRYGQQQQQQQQQSSAARRRGVFSASAPSHSVSGGCSPSPTAVVDTVLDSEATQMELPSDDSHTRHGALSNVGGEKRVSVDDYIAEGLMSRQSSVSAQRATSPAPRMAVTLPDSFQGTFSESCSVLASLPIGAELQRHHRESGEGNSVEGDARGEVGVAGAAATTLAEAQDSGLDLSFFSFRRDGGRGSRDVTGERAEDGAKEDAEGSEDCSRTWSRTPPPRRAFVLSRRCSAASITTTHDNNNNEEEEAMAEGEKTEEAPRGSEMLVTRDSDAVGFSAFQLPRAREGEGRNRQQHHHFRQPSPEERTMSKGNTAASLPRPAEAEGVPLSAEKKTAAPSSDAVTTPTKSNDALPAGEDADTSMYPYHQTTGLRLSDYVSGSRRSSMMMSPLPRPVMSAAQGGVAAARAALRLSPAHAREDTTEEGEEEEAAKNNKLFSEAPDLSVCEEAVTAPKQLEATAVVVAPCPTSATVSVVEPRSLSPSSPSLVGARAPQTTKASTQPASAVITPTDTEVLPTHTATEAATKGGEEEMGEQPATTAVHHAALSSIEASTAAVKADLSSVATPTTSTTALTAVSSLWLVSGSTPTPLRRLRGDHDESTEVTTSAEAGRTTAGAVEQHRMSSPSLPSLPAASAVHNTLHEEREEGIAAGPIEQVSAESCSPEPQRPAESPAAATGEACVVTVSISPVVPDATEKEPRLHLDVHEANAAPAFRTEPTTAVHTHLRQQQQQQQQQQQKRYTFRSSPPVHRTSPPCRAYAADTMSQAPSSPSTTLSESARVSEEVRELVERAQAEVRRTRASLLATLRDRRAEFHLPDLPPAAKTATADATPATTPTRALVLTDTVTGADRNGEEAAVVVKSPADVRTARPSGEVRAAALSLRRTLAESADAIHRRLCGYDIKEHGVLPMETVVRVTYFVVTRRHMPAATWTLRTAEGGVATTPLRASMAKKEAMQPPSGWMLSATKGGVGATPRGQRLTMERGATMVSNSASSRKRSRSNPHDDHHHNDSSTCSSPSRTLESVMAHQERRAEEEEYLNFYFTVLEAFKQVFGERYAWRHLGATNASRHDSLAARQQRVKVDCVVAATRKGGETPTALTKAAEKDVSSPAELDVYNELNEMEGPLETVFPRLRQHYALRQGDGTATTPHAGVAAARPPPLDVLVYYRTFTDSLREL